jgi:hypothetical protein
MSDLGEEKKFDRDIREKGLTRYQFITEIVFEIGDEQPGWAYENIISTILEKCESALEIRPLSIKVIGRQL